jgi:hypothetical protein
MTGKFLAFIVLSTAVACGGGSYSNPEPATGDDEGNGNDAAVTNADAVPIDRVVGVARGVLADEGWTVFRVDRSGNDHVIEARRGGDELLRIYVTPNEDELMLRGWSQKGGEPQGSTRLSPPSRRSSGARA